MTEKEKMLNGQDYWALDPELMQDHHQAKILCQEYNQTSVNNVQEKLLILEKLFHADYQAQIEPNFFCDYGYNIKLGKNFYANHNLVILDGALVTIGDNALIGPNVGIYTTGHPIDVTQRNAGIQSSQAITIGNNVWIGGGVNICPGVTIGDNCVIGAGSVVINDIPADSVAVGNPCKKIKSSSQS